MEVIRTSIVQSACAVILLVVLLHLGMKLPVAMDANALTSREEMAVISRNMMTAMSSLVWDIFPYFNHPRWYVQLFGLLLYKD